jgi:ATP-dependent DNA helicase DinG
MEKSATSYFSEELNRFGINRLLNRLYSRRRTQVRGVWVQLQKITSPGQDDERVPPLLEEIRKKVDLLETLAATLMGQELAFRITPGVDKTVLEEALLNPMGELKLLLFQLVSLLQKALERVDEEDQEEGAVYEGRMLLSRLMGASSLCETYSEWQEKPDKVFWISRERTRKGDGFLRFVITPLDISGVMAEAVFQPFDTVVCTSATMSVKASFDYWMRQVGLSTLTDKTVRAFQFPSPFPYQERVLLQIPADAPEPNHPDYGGYLSRKVIEILTLSEGHGLVLFTSYTQLRQVFEETSPALQAAGIPLLKQGDDDRARLLEEFKKVSSSVLFATSSFWEGIDTPGSSLQVVIICKLPFQVPSDPVIAARREALERRGGNAFIELFLPEAVMRLKQGFGRLMRRSSDRGAVIILDSRIVRKSYGTMFLDSLPPARRSIKGGAVLLEELESFLYP